MASSSLPTMAATIDYFKRALFLDLCNSHGNTADGVHIASTGGVWAGIVHGFAGMVEHGNHLTFAPRLPAIWDSVTFRLTRHGCRVRVDLDHDGCTLTVEDGIGVPVEVAGEQIVVTEGQPLRIPALVPV